MIQVTDEPRWPDDIPPPHAELYGLGERALTDVNRVAAFYPTRSPIEHNLIELLRSQALAIGVLSAELLRLRAEAACWRSPGEAHVAVPSGTDIDPAVSADAGTGRAASGVGDDADSSTSIAVERNGGSS